MVWRVVPEGNPAARFEPAAAERICFVDPSSPVQIGKGNRDMSASRWMADASANLAHVFAYLTQSTWAQRRGEPGLCDFVVGNPLEMPLISCSAVLFRCAGPLV